LDNIPSPYCYNCYRSKENLHVCNSVEEEMPPHIDSGDESDNESVVDANGHESGTVTHQWYNGRPSEVSSPDLSGCVDKVDARVTIQRWARQLGIKAVSYGGDTHKLVMRCGIGGRVRERKHVSECDVEKTRRSTTLKAIDHEHRCPFQMNARCDKATKIWSVTKMTLEHNHPPSEHTKTIDHMNRLHDLTPEQRQFLACLASTSLEPHEVLQTLYAVYPKAPLLSSQDIKNITSGPKGGTQDAHTLLSNLMDYKAQDNRWVVEFILDSKGRLTHLFWMSATQRSRVADVPSILIHDNTYLTNQFGLPLGLFSSVDR